MTIQSDIVTALSAVASGKVYPEVAPQDAVVPLVIYRRVLYEPLTLIHSPVPVGARSSFVFECWAATKAGALTLAASVRSAIEATASFTDDCYLEPVSGEDYESVTDEFVEPVQYSFWH
jgi:hypothetical protein